jgi:putative addiction module CopG family antidote
MAERHLHVILSEELAALVERKVASGEYADESEVVRDGLRALDEHDEVERWLWEEVAPTYDGYIEGRIETYSLDEVKTHLAQHIAGKRSGSQ